MSNYRALLGEVNTFVFDYDGVMTQGIILITNDGEPLRTANVKDGYALQLLKKLGYRIAVISGGYSPSMEKRLGMLGLTDIFLGVSDKKKVFSEYLIEHQLNPKQVLYMGDDIPDLPAMQMAGVPVCPADAANEIKEISVYISHIDGGKGCVRDVIEQVLKVHKKWLSDTDAHVW